VIHSSRRRRRVVAEQVGSAMRRYPQPKTRAEQVRLLVLTAYDRLFGLELEHLAVDGCITKAPCGGQTAGPSPVDRRKQGLKRSVAVDAHGVPPGAVAAPANRRDDGLLSATLDTLG
jgi:hypothetical protein